MDIPTCPCLVWLQILRMACRSLQKLLLCFRRQLPVVSENCNFQRLWQKPLEKVAGPACPGSLLLKSWGNALQLFPLWQPPLEVFIWQRNVCLILSRSEDWSLRMLQISVVGQQCGINAVWGMWISLANRLSPSRWGQSESACMHRSMCPIQWIGKPLWHQWSHTCG